MPVHFAQVGFLGPATLDFFTTLPGAVRTGSKHDCSFEVKPGGGAINGARQAQQLGMDAALVAITGADPMACVTSTLIRNEFSKSVLFPALAESRISVLFGGTCLTSRPSLTIHQIPSDALDLLSTCQAVVLAPGTPNDTDCLLSTLGELPAGCRTILQLSASQLDDANCASLLMKASDLLIVNEAEACRFARCPYPYSAAEALREAGADNLVVTSSTGVRAHLDHAWHSVAAFPVDEVKETVGAGDVFTGTFASAVAVQRSWRSCLTLGLAAAALHVMGKPMPGQLDDVISEVSGCNQKSHAERHRTRTADEILTTVNAG